MRTGKVFYGNFHLPLICRDHRQGKRQITSKVFSSSSRMKRTLTPHRHKRLSPLLCLIMFLPSVSSVSMISTKTKNSRNNSNRNLPKLKTQAMTLLCLILQLSDSQTALRLSFLTLWTRTKTLIRSAMTISSNGRLKSSEALKDRELLTLEKHMTLWRWALIWPLWKLALLREVLKILMMSSMTFSGCYVYFRLYPRKLTALKNRLLFSSSALLPLSPIS